MKDQINIFNYILFCIILLILYFVFKSCVNLCTNNEDNGIVIDNNLSSPSNSDSFESFELRLKPDYSSDDEENMFDRVKKNNENIISLDIEHFN